MASVGKFDDMRLLQLLGEEAASEKKREPNLEMDVAENETPNLTR